jgi:hypothetical protein
MNTNGLSTMATGQMERMIDDMAWITYPLHLAVGIIKTFVYVGLFILAAFISLTVWLMNAHDNRAEWSKNFVAQESVYRVSFASKTIYPVVAKRGTRFLNTDMAELVWGCPTTSKDLKTRTMFADNWLEEKSDAFQSAYIAASCNMVSLTERLKEAKGDFSRLPNMPNASVVLVSFLKSTDYEQMVPADYRGNWYTGMCLIGAKCTDADFVPRNMSIFYDAVAPQMTANQDAAVKALYATATRQFWVAAAHANGIYDKDAEFASYAADEQADLAKKLRHQESSADEFAHEVEFGIGLYIAFVVLLCACFTRHTHKSLSP